MSERTNRDELVPVRQARELVAVPPGETPAPLPAHLQTASDKRRAVERELACFTPAQQRAIAIICGQWWESRLEAINVGEVEELRDKLDFLLESLGEKMPTQAQIATWKAKRGRQLQGPRG